MTKEEARLSVMGAISMALKSPTLQHGFEIICKNLAELEAYNKKLLQSDIDKQNKIVLLSQKVNDLQKENAELKARIGLSIDCEKAQKNGELCLGYGGDEDEPCERCKNCIKCECGYYQLGETEKDEQVTKAKEIIKKYLAIGGKITQNYLDVTKEAEQFINNEGCPDCFCEDCTKEDCGIKKLGLVEVEK